MALSNTKQYDVSREIFGARPAPRGSTIKSMLADRLVNSVRGVVNSRELPKTETIMTCFKASTGETTCSYAYLYSQCDSEIKHIYYTCCPTYSSQDGEYRHRVSQFNMLEGLHKKYEKLLEGAEAAISRAIDSGLLELDIMFCFPFSCRTDAQVFKEDINVRRLAIQFFAIAWLLDVDAIKKGQLENHINPAYEHIMGTVARDEHDKLEFTDEAKLALSGFVNGTEYGQKFYPLTYKEIIGSGDIFFPTWHELIIGDKCSDLLLNFISPSFPAAGSWTFVQNVGADVYDNAAMREKYANSVRVADIIRQLQETDKYNYVEKARGRGFINNKFLELSKNIHKSIEYAEANIRLTDVLLCGFGEYTGRTYRDIPLLDSPRYQNAFYEPGHFRRHMFEFVYSLWCMNSKLGIMHGDLHVNNITLKMETMARDVAKEPKVAYIVEGAVYTYDHDFTYSCIIDFSRAIYGDQDSIAEAFGADYARRYLKTQTYRALSLLNKYMPRFFSKFKKDIMDIAFFDKFPLFFKVVTAMDPYCIATNMMSLILTYKEHRVDPEITRLLTSIAHEAESLIIKLIRRIFAGEIKHPDDIEWPCLTVLRTVFGADAADEFIEGATYYDVFNSGNAVKYNIRDRDNLGPIVGSAADIKKYDPETEKVLELTKRFVESEDEMSDDEWIY